MTARRALSDEELEVLRSFARRIDPSDAGAYNNLGVLYFRKGLAEEAIAAFSRALALDEKMRVARRNLEIAYGESDTLQRRIEQLSTRLANNPDDIEALVQSGIAEKTTGDLAAAQSLFERAIAIDPQSSVVHYLLGETLYNRGMSEDALWAVKRSLSLHPDNPDSHYLLGFIFGDLGRNDEAAEANRKALSLNPTLTRAQANLSLETARAPITTPVGGEAAGPSHVALGLAYRQKGYYEEALRSYERAAKAGSEAAALEGMIEVHLLRRDADAAVAAGEKFLATFPATPKILNEQGAALQMLGRHDEAENKYQAALNLDDHYAFRAQQSRRRPLAQRGCARIGERFPSRASGSIVSHGGEVEPGARPLPAKAFRSRSRSVSPGDSSKAGSSGRVERSRADSRRAGEIRGGAKRVRAGDQAEPTFAEAHYNMSFTLSRLGDFNSALRETKQALAINPLYSAQRLALALELPRQEAAIFVGPALTQAIGTSEGIPDFQFDPAILEDLFAPAASAPAGNGDTPTHGAQFALARDYLSKGLLDRAQAEIARVIGRGGNRGEGLQLAGEAFRAQGLHGEALERFNALLELDPGNREGLRGSAQSLLSLGRVDEALPVAEWLVANKDLTPRDMLIVAEARIATGAVASGREALARAIDEGSGRATDLAYAAELHTSLGEHQRAVELLKKSVSVDRNSIRRRIALARALIAAGQDAEALGELRAALDQEPANQDAQLELVSLFRRKREPRAALNVLVRLLHTDIYHFGALILLGETLLDLGRESDARRAFERVIRFDPNHETAIRHLESLQAEVG